MPTLAALKNAIPRHLRRARRALEEARTCTLDALGRIGPARERDFAMIAMKAIRALECSCDGSVYGIVHGSGPAFILADHVSLEKNFGRAQRALVDLTIELKLRDDDGDITNEAIHALRELRIAERAYQRASEDLELWGMQTGEIETLVPASPKPNRRPAAWVGLDPVQNNPRNASYD